MDTMAICQDICDCPEQQSRLMPDGNMIVICPHQPAYKITPSQRVEKIDLNKGFELWPEQQLQK